MEEPREEAGSDAARRLRRRGRATRALIAGYVHELSERHNGGASGSKPVTERDAKEALR
jgi:hypothetical protein